MIDYKRLVLRVNLNRHNEHFIIITEKQFQKFMDYLLEEERYEDMSFLRDNKYKMVQEVEEVIF